MQHHSYIDAFSIGNFGNMLAFYVDFVFENDPSYNAITLFDLEGNVVNVNSWVECAHYVNGGWSNVSTVSIDGNRLIFFGLILCTLLYVGIKKIYLSYGK